MKNILFLDEDSRCFDGYNKFFFFLENKAGLSDELLKFIKENQIDTLVCRSGHIKLASDLLWITDTVKRYILADTEEPLLIEDSNKKIETKMWNIIAARSGSDPIKQGGWFSSFTNESFTEKEMEEWAQNSADKLMPYITKESKVLEIGIASGITCRKAAPLVQDYIGVDISEETLKRTKEALQQNGLLNVSLILADALDAGNLEMEKRDIVIINSVAQYFAGYNYFIAVIGGLINCMKEKGIIFLGDILDYDQKDMLEKDLEQKGIRRKNVRDLYYPKRLIRELPVYVPEIRDIEITEKKGQIENELKKYRYDVVLHIDQNQKSFHQNRTKFQYAMLKKDFSIENIINFEENCGQKLYE